MSSGSLGALLSTPGPTVAVTIAPDHLAAVQVSWVKGQPTVAAYARSALDDGLVTPSVQGANVTDQPQLAKALRELLGQLPRRPTRVALVLPDSAAKVSLVRFENVPPRSQDLDQLIRWQVRKAAPFRVEDAQVAYTLGAKTETGEQEFVVALIRTDVVEQYEQACADAGAHAGCVDLASFNLINVALAAANGTNQGDWLLVHVAPGYRTLAIVRGPHLIFFRNRVVDGDGNLADLVHQTAMYYEDRLGGAGLSRALLSGHSGAGGAGTDRETVRTTLEERLQTTVEPLAELLTDRFGTPTLDAEALDRLAAPIGILLRDRQAN